MTAFIIHWLCTDIIGICCVVMLVEDIYNLELLCSKKNKAKHGNKGKFSVAAIIYIVFIYGQLLFGWWQRWFGDNIFEFSFISWAGNMLYYCHTSMGIGVMGFLNLVSVVILHERGKIQNIKRIWILLKIGMIPFYLLNVVHFMYESEIMEGTHEFTLMVSMIILPILYPVMLFLLPCAFNFLNGCIGWYYIHYLRKQNKRGKRPVWMHYVLQAFPILDLISMTVILKRYECDKMGE